MAAQEYIRYALYGAIGIGGIVIIYKVLQKYGILSQATVGEGAFEGTYESVPQPMRASPELRLKPVPQAYGIREWVAVLEDYRAGLHGEGGVGIRGIWTPPSRIWHDFGTGSKPSEGTYT